MNAEGTLLGGLRHGCIAPSQARRVVIALLARENFKRSHRNA
jgi:glucosamine 6-phosphate synthetase-like amidotransferase/phosphosugar isomerase protein